LVHGSVTINIAPKLTSSIFESLGAAQGVLLAVAFLGSKGGSANRLLAALRLRFDRGLRRGPALRTIFFIRLKPVTIIRLLGWSLCSISTRAN
jgi:hypothetical protein